jgi:DNA topoisomerase-1
MLTGHFGDIINIPYSARMENELDAIAAHQVEKEKTLADFYKPFEQLLEEADRVIPKDPPPLQLSGEKCELCGKDMVIREGRFGKFQACSGFPQCHNTKPLLVTIGVSCPKCGGEVTQRRTKTGRVFYGCEHYPECDFTSWDRPTDKPCPVCGKQLLERTEGNGRIKYFCSDPECTNAAPKRVGRRKKVTTASLMEGETADTEKKTAKRKTAKKKRTKKTGSRKKGAGNTVKKAEE